MKLNFPRYATDLTSVTETAASMELVAPCLNTRCLSLELGQESTSNKAL